MTDHGQKRDEAKKDGELKKAADDAAVKARADTTAKRAKEIKDNLDKLLDEIDDLLEENAEEFVKSYVQRGGE